MFRGELIENSQRTQAQEGAIEQAMAELEKLVGLRTAELTEANRKLLLEIGERKQAEEELRKSEERFRRYFELGLIGIAITSPTKGWIEVNDQICRILGYDRSELLKMTWAELTHPDDLAADAANFDRILAGEIEGYSMDKRFIRRDGQVIHSIISVKCVRRADRSVDYLVGLLQDITERKSLEEERGRYTTQVSALARASLVINSLDSLEETLKTITDRAREIIGAHQSVTGLTINQKWAQAIIGLSLSEKYAAYRSFDAKPDGSGIYAVVCETNRPIRMTQAQMEAHPRWRAYSDYAGQHPPLRGWLAAPLIGRDGRNIGLIQLSDKYDGDFTETDEAILMQFAQLASVAIENAQLFQEARAAKEQLQTLSHRLVKIQEAERHTVARELHDEVGQVLTGIKLSLETSMREQTDSIKANLAQALGLTNELIGRVRDLSLELRPAMLDDLGLLAALTWHFDRYTTQTQINVDFKQTGVEGRRFASEVETAAYRIVQEGLTNVARHAGVDKVEVDVWADESAVRIRVKDRGTGFDPHALSGSATGGLSGMRERAIMLGGRLNIESSPGAGTLLKAELSLTDKALADDDPTGD